MTTMDENLSPLQRWYTEKLCDEGNFSESARYKVNVFTLQAKKNAILEVQLNGDFKNLYNPETPKRVKNDWNDIGLKEADLVSEAYVAHEKAGFPSLNSVREEALPEFMRDGIGRWVEANVATGWYQNKRGELFKYDGVVWDVVPSERISDLEFLG